MSKLIIDKNYDINNINIGGKNIMIKIDGASAQSVYLFAKFNSDEKWTFIHDVSEH